MMNHKNRLSTTVMSVALMGMVGLLSACGGGGGSAGSGGAKLTQMGGSIQESPLVLAGSVSTIAGTNGGTGATDGTVGTKFNYPRCFTTDGANLYVVDTGSNTIRKIVIATGAVTTVAGGAGLLGSTDGIGAAARFDTPYGITTDGINLYVADSYNHTIRKIVIATRAVTTIAGSAGVAGSADGTVAARFTYPYGITTDGVNLYVADTNNYTIRKIVLDTGAVTTVAGSAGVIGSADGTTAARFNYPYGITTDGSNLYVADSGSHTIRKIVIATGAVTTVAGSAGASGAADGTVAARFNFPYGITTDGVNLYVADTSNHTIRKIVIATGVVATVSGSAGVIGSADGTAAARFKYPEGIATDGLNLYVADTYNHIIRKIQ